MSPFHLITGLTDLLSQLPDLGAWGLWGLFIGTFLSATVVPFSADVLYVTMLQMTSNPWACLAVASLGNWLGCLTTFGLGRLGRWDWIEKLFKVDRAKLEKQKVYIDRYGIWLALFSWLPFVGDLLTLALGFYKTNPWLTALLLLVGRFLRFFVWNLVLGAV
ncbi:MAG: DedA family protein [Bacteroidales bacterium]|jgi:membrane protein YqaA with SNARE-associated domain|nr:DedA family protein [Bacteroidales bacterium]